MALDRETVVRTALRVLDAEGLDGLTLRRIAGELEVKAPALYWHFRDKRALLDEMATTVLRDALAGFGAGDLPADWREFALAYGRGLRATLLRYRDGAKMISGTFLTDEGMYEPMERALERFVSAGFALRDAVRGLSVIYCFTVGFAIEEQAVFPRPGERDARYDLAAREERTADLSLVRETGAESLDGFDERFEHGLAVIVRGLAPA